MKLVLQPPNSRLCGQCCLATAAFLTLTEACELVGHAHWTTTKEMAAAFRKFGYKCGGDRLVRILDKRPVPRHALVKVNIPNQPGWHWVLCWNGAWYDPAGLGHNYPPGTEISSFLEVIL